MYNKVLVPLDGSSLAEAALPHARALAECTNAQVVLLRVAIDPGAEFAFADPSIAEPLVEQMETEAKKYLSAVARELYRDGFKVSTMMREGPVAETILDVAAEIGADVIVMCTHGRTGPARWLMGSIADRVVRGSKVPVMLIRPKP